MKRPLVTFTLPDLGGDLGQPVATQRGLEPAPHREVSSVDQLGLLADPRLVGLQELHRSVPHLLHLLPVEAGREQRGETR